MSGTEFLVDTKPSSLDLSYNHRSPISCLPVELIGEIFTYSSQPSTQVKSRRGVYLEVDPYTQFHSTCSPMSLTHVNRHWRDVALSMPLLWSTLLLRGCLNYHPALVKCWLERSGNCPLKLSLQTIRFCQGRMDDEFTWGERDSTHPKQVDDASNLGCSCQINCPLHDDAIVTNIMALLVEHASRWQDVTFDTCFHHPTAFLDLQKGQLSSLRNIQFHQNDLFPPSLNTYEADCIKQNDTSFWGATQDAPLLRTISLTDLVPTYAPWAQLNDLTLGYTQDVTMLSQCTNLQILKIHGLAAPPLPVPILLPNLHTLEIPAFWDNCRLDSMTVPSLKHLELSVSGLCQTVSILENCLARSSAKLESLNIRISCLWAETENGGDDMYEAEEPGPLIQLLSNRSITSLISFSMTETAVPRSLLHALSSPEQPLLSNAHHLALGCSEETPDSDLVKLAISRRGLPLSKLNVVFNKTFVGSNCVFCCREIPELCRMESPVFKVVIEPGK